MKRINDLLRNQGENYILPFFWQHGETEAKLREYMNAIHDCGIGAVCVECRPHPDFCGPKWWEDMDVIIDEAKKLDMKVWILDDAHFPTGQANGAMEEAPAEQCKQFVYYSEFVVSGPMPGAGIDVAAAAKYVASPFGGGGGMGGLFGAAKPGRTFDDDELISVVAAEGDGKGIDGATLIDLTDKVVDGQLEWDVPAGMWRLLVIYKTRNGGGNVHYINVVNARSCKVQIDAVYEPHWEHYKDEFGKTIQGFFSDEPEFGNSSGGMQNWIGRKMQLPWSEEVEEELKNRWGEDYGKLLSTLWFPDTVGAVSAYARYHYMDVVTRAVERDFSHQIGDWCEAHGVRYIGHTIEDNNQHARLSQSFGHQFRGLGGQHMGGIDDIGGQVLFGGDKMTRSSAMLSTDGDPMLDGEFFHYLLGKLGASHGHLDPRKSGNSMCEIFGAYGWGEGTRLMKYLVDHFMVRGINHFVPHAFSPKEFPDFDCPPHFYAHGLNPLYKGFGELMRYVNRVCHLISGGTPKPAVGVLYHAEGEWTSREEGYMLSQKPIRVLAQAQIDSDVIWTDLLTERERFGTVLGETLTVNGVNFKALVIPYSYYITSHLAEFLAEAVAVGFPVYFVGGKPAGIADKPYMAMPAAVEAVPVVELEELAEVMTPYADVQPDAPFAQLRYLRYGHESDLYLITNESTAETFSGKVKLAGEGTPVLYDAMANQLRPADWDGEAVSLTLQPYESVVVAFGVEGAMVSKALPEGEKIVIDGPWKVSFKAALEQAAGYQNEMTLETLHSLAKTAPEFSGWVRYETTVIAPKAAQAVLCFENAYETAEVTVNGQNAGMVICPPYQFDISGLLVEGENSIVVEVATTLERAVDALTAKINDPRMAIMKIFSGNSVGNPFGLIGEAAVWVK